MISRPSGVLVSSVVYGRSHILNSPPMPTPNHELTLSSPELDSHVHWAHQHTSCPPDGPRLETWGRRSPQGTDTDTQDTTESGRAPEQAATATVVDGPADAVDGPIKSNKVEVVADDGLLLSPVSTISDVKDSESQLSPCRVASSTVTHSPSSSMSYEFSNVRVGHPSPLMSDATCGRRQG